MKEFCHTARVKSSPAGVTICVDQPTCSGPENERAANAYFENSLEHCFAPHAAFAMDTDRVRIRLRSRKDPSKRERHGSLRSRHPERMTQGTVLRRRHSPDRRERGARTASRRPARRVYTSNARTRPRTILQNRTLFVEATFKSNLVITGSACCPAVESAGR